MVGRTNAGHAGGGGTAFEAYIQVATDANASITAVNLAGDTFSGTADATGALVLTVTAPGTYTVTETDGGQGTVTVSDYGVTYQITVIAFDGFLVQSGVEKVDFTTRAISASSPSVAYNQIIDGENAIKVQEASGGIGQYLTSDFYSISDYPYLTVRGYGYQVFVTAVDPQNNITHLGRLSRQGYGVDTQSFILSSSLDETKSYKFGLHLTGSTNGYLVNLKLQ